MKTIMLVDDSATILLSISNILAKAGYATEKAANAEEALNLLEHTYQSVVLSDVDLGDGMHGVELMRLIAQRYPFLPRILMSGLPPEILPSRYGLSENHALLSKPFTIPQLDASIRQAIANLHH